jgi:hypothetical protein
MAGEKEVDYAWALGYAAQDVLGEQSLSKLKVITSDSDTAFMNAVASTLPDTVNLLCSWHINKDLAKHHKRSFKDDATWEAFLRRWQEVIRCATPEEFENAWESLRFDNATPPLVADYLQTTWIPRKERFVHAWTDQYRHLGHNNSSRGEGAHSRIKGYIETSRGDLLTVFERIELAHAAEIREITAQIQRERQKVEHKHRDKLYDAVRMKVSQFALNKAYEQQLLVRYSSRSGGIPLKPCTGAFEQV